MGEGKGKEKTKTEKTKTTTKTKTEKTKKRTKTKTEKTKTKLSVAPVSGLKVMDPGRYTVNTRWEWAGRKNSRMPWHVSCEWVVGWINRG